MSTPLNVSFLCLFILGFLDNITDPEPESRAFADGTSYTIIIVMEFENCLHYGKSKTCSDNLSLVVLRAVIFVEYQLDLVLLDALSRVFDLNKNAIGAVYLTDKNFLIIACVIHRIVDEIIDDLLDLHNVTAYSSLLVGSELDAVSFFLGNSRKSVNYLAQLGTDAEFRGSNFCLPLSSLERSSISFTSNASRSVSLMIISRCSLRFTGLSPERSRIISA